MSTRRQRARLWCERVAFRVHGITHPYAYQQMRRGSGAWGRITKHDRELRARLAAVETNAAACRARTDAVVARINVAIAAIPTRPETEEPA